MARDEERLQEIRERTTDWDDPLYERNRDGDVSWLLERVGELEEVAAILLENHDRLTFNTLSELFDGPDMETWAKIRRVVGRTPTQT